MANYKCDVLVIGSGVTGYGAGMYSARFNLKTIVVGKDDGGTINLTDDVANYPGFINLTGIELSTKLKNHALDYKDIKLIPGEIKELKNKHILKQTYFKVKPSSCPYESNTIPK